MARLVIGERAGRSGTLRFGCSVAVFDVFRTNILLMKRDDNGLWCLPGGGMDPGESTSELAEREIREETGLTVRVTGLIGLYSSPHVLVEYADGNRFQIISTCFEACVADGVLTTTNEARDVGFFSEEEIARMSIMQNHVERIRDAFADDGTSFVR
jgi:ADP-ribose pyrophosphatase YjhB (NUDIX family)